jgi:hypothetical protein
MQLIQRPLMSSRPHRLGRLGVPFVGASKEDAKANWYAVDSAIVTAKNSATLYPNAQAFVQFWPRMGQLQAEFYARRDVVLGQLPGITNWDEAIAEAKAYSDKFLALEKAVLDEARRTGEAKGGPTPRTPGSPDDPNKEDNTMLYVGLGVAVLLAIGLSVSLNRQ